MNTKILTINDINIASNIIKAGGLVAFPTETVYGLGANGLNGKAVNKIFVAKGRPRDNPLILHVSSIAEVKKLVEEIPQTAKKLMISFWPGPLTIIFKKSEIVPDEVTCGLDSVAIRMPDNKIALELIRLSKCPLAAPSANLSGKPSPTCARHVIDDLNGKVDAIIKGGRTKKGIESTVIDLTTDIPTILRPGMIYQNQIEKIIGKVEMHSKNSKVAKSPGMKYKHYSPDAKVIFVDSKNYKKIVTDLIKYYDKKQICIFCTNKNSKYNAKHIYLGATPTLIAKNLFYQFREMDTQNIKIIIVEPLGKDTKWDGIRNRLLKASSEHIV